MSRNARRAAPRPQPKEVEGLWNARTMFYRKRLELMIKGVFEVDYPIDWELDYFLNLLIYEGRFVITNSVAGILPFRTTFSGVNYMNLPTKAVIDVPTFKQMKRTLNKDAVLIFLERDSTGYGFYTFRDMIDIFAERLASADACIDVNLMNSRVAYIAEAETRAQAETIKDVYSKVTNGEPLVVVRKGSTDGKIATNGMQVFFNNLHQNYIANDVQDTKRSIYNEFLTCLGVNNANTDKKERLITGEVDSNNQELMCNVSHIKANIKQQLEHVKDVFPDLKFNIKLKFDALNEKAVDDAISGDNRTLGVPSPGKQ